MPFPFIHHTVTLQSVAHRPFFKIGGVIDSDLSVHLQKKGLVCALPAIFRRAQAMYDNNLFVFHVNVIALVSLYLSLI
jgi:hypothetical protein